MTEPTTTSEDMQKLLERLAEIIELREIDNCDICGELEELCGYHQRMIDLAPDLFKKLAACEAQNTKVREALEKAEYEVAMSKSILNEFLTEEMKTAISHYTK